MTTPLNKPATVLTDDEIATAWKACKSIGNHSFMFEFALAIEAAILAKQAEAVPVAWLKYWAYQQVTQDGNVNADEGWEVCREGEIGVDGVKAIPVYAAPAPKSRDFSETKCPHCDMRFFIEREVAAPTVQAGPWHPIAKVPKDQTTTTGKAMSETTTSCNHPGLPKVPFDEKACKGKSTEWVRKHYPRLQYVCQVCETRVICYASDMHYYAGDY